MAWNCDTPTSFDVDTLNISDIDAGDRVNWYLDGSWWRPTSNGDFITFGFTVSAGKRAYVNVQGLNDSTDRGFDVRIDGGSWMHENGTGGSTGSLVTVLSVPDVTSESFFPDDYGTGWESGIRAGEHTFELRAAYATNPTNLIRFEVSEYTDCPTKLRVGMHMRPV